MYWTSAEVQYNASETSKRESQINVTGEVSLLRSCALCLQWTDPAMHKKGYPHGGGANNWPLKGSKVSLWEVRKEEATAIALCLCSLRQRAAAAACRCELCAVRCSHASLWLLAGVSSSSGRHTWGVLCYRWAYTGRIARNDLDGEDPRLRLVLDVHVPRRCRR